MAAPQVRLTSSEPILAVRDVPATIDFYRRTLGFTSHWLWGTPPTFGGARIDAIHFMFCLQPDLAAHVKGHMHFINVENVDALYAQHQAAGAKILRTLRDEPWGCREYIVEDPNGYHLRFAGQVGYTPPPGATRTLPDTIQIIPRRPTVDEFMSLARSINWNGDPAITARALANSLHAVVAVDMLTQSVIGAARIVGDSARFYYIQDVMVAPSFQGRRVGTEMMKSLLDWLRANAPSGASVSLFTGKPAFYERLGFCKDTAGMTLNIP